MRQPEGTRPGLGLIAWRVLLFVALCLLTWRVVVLGLANRNLAQLIDGDPTAAQRVLNLVPGEARALYEDALALLPIDPTAAEARMVQAYQKNPTRAMPLISLADLARERGDSERGDALVEAAVRIDPSYDGVQRGAALYWFERGQFERGMGHLSMALVADAAANQDILQILLAFAEDPDARVALTPLATAAPPWWSSFFQYLSQQARDLESVRWLFEQRSQNATTPVPAEERQAFSARLLRDGLYEEAFDVWAQGLNAQELRHLGLLYNGDFELPLGKQDFDWVWQPLRQVQARTAATLGVGGERALQLSFRALQGRFQQLHQTLLLDPGTYRLAGKVRVDGLASEGGLRWTVTCLQPEEARTVLGESERFLGSENWRNFSLDFEVPQTCRLQQVGLESAGRLAFEQRISGEIWFDDLSINPTQGLSAAAKADLKARHRAALAAGDQGGEQGEGRAGDAGQGRGGGGDQAQSPLLKPHGGNPGRSPILEPGGGGPGMSPLREPGNGDQGRSPALEPGGLDSPDSAPGDQDQSATPPLEEIPGATLNARGQGPGESAPQAASPPRRLMREARKEFGAGD